jgi:hypothetical protein
LRAELEKLVVAELLGPVGGEREQLPGRDPVRDRYLVGMLAPRGTVAIDAERNDDAGVGGDGRLADAGAFTDQTAQPVRAPSSIGMSFGVTESVAELDVACAWGRYVKERPTSEDEATAKYGVWQRYPTGGTVKVTLVEGEIGPISVTSEHPDVVVQGRCRRRAETWFVSLFLVNGQDAQKQNRDEAWLFQPELSVSAGDRGPVFVGRHEAIEGPTTSIDPEDGALDLLYRDQVEFATGHDVAVDATRSPDDSRRAVRITTSVVPTHEVAKVDAPTAADQPGLADVVLSMKRLWELEDAGLAAALLPLADAYGGWLDGQWDRIDDPAERLEGHADVARAAVLKAREAGDRLRAGIDLLGHDPLAAEAFRFANETMHRQRLHTLAAGKRRRNPSLTLESALTAAEADESPSWRPFQLAFILINLPSLTHPTDAERGGPQALVDLLFFPTGGGKTEAYLGLTAYTLAIRRLQGMVGEFDGSGGVAVLMRYTLRLLTTQQFQRATALICACEIGRRARLAAGDRRWGDTPFRIGMWVGSTVSPLNFDDAREALDQLRAGSRGSKASNPVQLVSCPWCGSAIDAAKHARSDVDRWRTLVFCGDDRGLCEFTERRSPGEGLPVLTVDEEIYRLLPSMVIATVDKFAQLPWQGPLHLLFGRVATRCSRHGYRSPDLDKVGQRTEADKHNRTGQLDKAETQMVKRLRPPDLIIQDELHLISGPLGTLVGLYESAIDELASWTVDDTKVRPKVVASTATIRRAREQTRELFWRDLAVFPPQVIDARDSFFAAQRSTAVTPGRRYLGVCAPGARLKAVETRVFTAALAAAKRLWDLHGEAADPWMTCVGYFMALRELGGMRRLMEDDVSSRLRRTGRKGLGERRFMEIRELTSRIGSSDIPEVLDLLGVPYKSKYERGETRSIDVLLATNMISVGVDVQRLGLMIVVGQPKATAEYIQATSRVGRDDRGPGLVVTVYNGARPRDLSHYETFNQYHATFYRHVEALSVTPFAPRALDRGLTGVMVALTRHLNPEWNPNRKAMDVPVGDAAFTEIADLLARRAEEVSVDPGRGQLVRDLIRDRLDDWGQLETRQKAAAAGLSYRERQGDAAGLLQAPTAANWTRWSCPTSLREVEANVNLIIDEADQSLGTAPTFGGPAPVATRVADTADDVAEDELPGVEEASEEAVA